MWNMLVERRSGEHFEPFIVDIENEGCVFVFHRRDITEDGADWFSRVMTDQAKRWLPRNPDMPRGGIIPVRIVREAGLPDTLAICLDDSEESITYYVDEDIISEYGADVISRKLTERSPHWHRVPDAAAILRRAV
ncbi:hypothetical protein ACFCWG_36800 [Streptomyces sp. NPDC056390]|uniref:hypothetical protein n=1 Tax=Streptomyces sp. NPDC056390 TaxID=3345806 RepID=UPI0035DF6B49